MMNYTEKLLAEDKNIVSWNITNITALSTEAPEKFDLKPTIVSVTPIDNNGITSARTRYTNNFYFYEKDVIIGQSIRIYGEYTQIEIDLLAQYINENTIVYDIGGNIGYHTVAFAHRAKHVYSFEPNIKNYTLLEMNTEKLKNVTLIKAAVSDKKGKSFISDYELNDQGNFGECMMNETTGQPCITLCVDDLNIDKPHVIKIDVEGHELKVFNGAKKTIRENTPVIFYEAMHGSGFDEIYDFLHTELGYNLYWIGVPNYNPRNHNNITHNVFGQGGVINILALPKEYPVDSYLEKMVDRNDTHIKFLQRLQERFNKRG
jgi:FkbM family methyltransferase